MSLKMKVGSYYYNKHAGVLQCHKYVSGVYVMVNKNFIHDVDAYGKDCTKYPNADYDLEYECDEYGNEIYVTQQTVSTKIDLELKIDTTDAVLSLKELQSELEKVKSIMHSEFDLEYECNKHGDKLRTNAQTECYTHFVIGDKVAYEDYYGTLQLGYVSCVLTDNEIRIKSAVSGKEVVRDTYDVYDCECLPCYDTDYGVFKVVDAVDIHNYLCLTENDEDDTYILQFVDKEWLHENGELINEYADNEHNVEHERKHSHYFKDVSNLDEIDVYAVLTLFEVTDPCIAHAVKKLLCTGNRGHKDFETDVQDAIDSLVRWKELNQDLTK